MIICWAFYTGFCTWWRLLCWLPCSLRELGIHTLTLQNICHWILNAATCSSKLYNKEEKKFSSILIFVKKTNYKGNDLVSQEGIFYEFQCIFIFSICLEKKTWIHFLSINLLIWKLIEVKSRIVRLIVMSMVPTVCDSVTTSAYVRRNVHYLSKSTTAKILPT